MYWTLELASKLEDAPWPATKDEFWKTLRMTVRFTKALRRSGPITPARRTSSSTRKNINP